VVVDIVVHGQAISRFGHFMPTENAYFGRNAVYKNKRNIFLMKNISLTVAVDLDKD